jgi:hypothetical protein
VLVTRIKDGLIGGIVAAVVSGVPSTLWALGSDGDVLQAARAAGNLLLPASSPPGALLVAGAVAHLLISLFWGAVLSLTLPARFTITSGALAGIAIAALDLALIGRAFPLIAALELGPQLADHIAFGVVCGVVLRLRRRAAEPGDESDQRPRV